MYIVNKHVFIATHAYGERTTLILFSTDIIHAIGAKLLIFIRANFLAHGLLSTDCYFITWVYFLSSTASALALLMMVCHSSAFICASMALRRCQIVSTSCPRPANASENNWSNA